MDETSIRQYAQLMKELELTGLEITENGKTVRLERTVPSQALSFSAPAPGTLSPAPATPTQTASAADQVLSPMVGVFYAAPAENEPPFVQVGDQVKKGDTLCIIEAMKLMNEVLAERDGVIGEILAQNGQIVEYGSPLFRWEGGAL